MSGEVYIRRFENKDVDQAYEVIHKSLNSHVLQKVYDDTILTSIWHDCYSKQYILGNAKLKHIYVAVTDEQIAGTIAAEPDGDKTYISMVYVNPDIQGKGIGKALMEAIEKDEYSLQSRHLYLYALLSANKFYQRCGYSFLNGIPEVINDCGIDCLPMKKFL